MEETAEAGTATATATPQSVSAPPVTPPTAADALAFGVTPAGSGDAAGTEDPAERVRRVEDLAGRLKTLKRRNTASKKAAKGSESDPAADGGPA